MSMRRIWKSILIAPPLTVSIALWGFSPVVQNSSDVTSPDLQGTATLELVDNNLGWGQGLLYDEIHLSPTKSWRLFWKHGNPDRSVIFYVVSGDTGIGASSVRWNDSRHLVVRYPDCHIPGRALPGLESVEISYEVFPIPAGTMATMCGRKKRMIRSTLEARRLA
jgi:hypothetical protein